MTCSSFIFNLLKLLYRKQIPPQAFNNTSYFSEEHENRHANQKERPITSTKHANHFATNKRQPIAGKQVQLDFEHSLEILVQIRQYSRFPVQVHARRVNAIYSDRWNVSLEQLFRTPALCQSDPESRIRVLQGELEKPISRA